MTTEEPTGRQSEDAPTREDGLLVQTIHAVLDATVTVADEASFTVPANELSVWADILDASTFYARLKSDGGAHAYLQARYRERWIFVHVYADMFEDRELPPLGSEVVFAAASIADASRLKVFESADAR